MPRGGRLGANEVQYTISDGPVHGGQRDQTTRVVTVYTKEPKGFRTTAMREAGQKRVTRDDVSKIMTRPAAVIGSYQGKSSMGALSRKERRCRGGQKFDLVRN